MVKPVHEPRCGGPLRPDVKHSYVGSNLCEKCGWNRELEPGAISGKAGRRRKARVMREMKEQPPCVNPHGHSWSTTALIMHCVLCGLAPEAGYTFKVKQPTEILPDPQGRTCFYCGVELTMPFNGSRQSRTCHTRDHVNPRALGGGTTVAACKYCNSQKAAFTISQWFTWRCIVGLPWPPEPLEHRGAHRQDHAKLIRGRDYRKTIDAMTLQGPASLVGSRTKASRK